MMGRGRLAGCGDSFAGDLAGQFWFGKGA